MECQSSLHGMPLFLHMAAGSYSTVFEDTRCLIPRDDQKRSDDRTTGSLGLPRGMRRSETKRRLLKLIPARRQKSHHYSNIRGESGRSQSRWRLFDFAKRSELKRYCDSTEIGGATQRGGGLALYTGPKVVTFATDVLNHGDNRASYISVGGRVSKIVFEEEEVRVHYAGKVRLINTGEGSVA